MNANPTSRKLDQSGLQAVYEELVLSEPEVKVTSHGSYLWVADHPESPLVAPRFRVVIRDRQTAARAERDRDGLRRLIKEAATRQGMADPGGLSKLAVKCSGRYVVAVSDLPGEPPTPFGMEWLMQRYDLD